MTASLLQSPRAAPAPAPPAAGGDRLVFLGTYTDYSILPHWPRGGTEGAGLMVARWAADKARLEVGHTVPVANPAFMKYHPRLNVLYVLSECIDTPGYLTAFSVDPANGALAQLGERLSMTGRSTCYISFDSDAGHAVVTNYWDAVLNVVKLDEETGEPLAVVQAHQQTRREQWRQVVDRPDHMANRQDGPHAHCVVFDPTYRWLFVPDLGDNGIHQYGWSNGRLTHQAFIPVAPGDGPRHFVFHPRLPLAYSGCELKSQVQVFKIDYSDPSAVKPRIAPLQRLGTLPAGFEGINYVGEIKIDAAGSRVYVSNRGHNSVACFDVDGATGLLTRAGIDSTLGRCPRHFGLAPDGRHAVIGDQDDDLVKVFRLCPASGRLAECVQEVSVPTPNFVLVTHVPLGAPRHAGHGAGAGASAAAEVAAEARMMAGGRQMAAAGVTVCAN
ncbi:MAG: Lactonase, 7-bladed beta-propeller-domain-containing protein [Monoraphidium minutum]|nr:MAG: Lactonase, 7-bladed beta-propeller-domain-containing protein [Monoraphidium minutum]